MTITEIFKSIKSDLLTEDVQKEISTLFEASVNEKVETKIDDLEKQFESYKEEQLKGLEENTKEYIETYLVEELSNYVKFASGEFMDENKLESENGIKAEMFDKMITGMKKVLSENNIEVNEAKGIENIEKDLKSSKEEYNKITKENMELKEKNELLESGIVFEKLAKDMSIEEKEKFGKMISDFDIDDLKLFEEKATIVKENMMKETTGDNNNSDDNTDDNIDNNFESNNVDGDDIENAMSI